MRKQLYHRPGSRESSWFGHPTLFYQASGFFFGVVPGNEERFVPGTSAPNLPCPSSHPQRPILIPRFVPLEDSPFSFPRARNIVDGGGEGLARERLHREGGAGGLSEHFDRKHPAILVAVIFRMISVAAGVYELQ
eukprot:1991839-Rhodomonas_salina.3